MRSIRKTLLITSTALSLLFAACGSDTSSTSEVGTGSTPTTLPQTATTSTVPPTTAAPTTTIAPTTTTRPTRLGRMLERGYTVSDEWVVETLVADINSGTGGLAVADDGTLYHADFGYPGHPGDAIYRIAPDGTVETFVESDEFNSLTMTVLTPDGRIYQSSYGSDKVFTIEPDGTIELLADGIRGPTGLVVLEDGTVFVESFNRSLVHRIDVDGTVTTFASGSGLNGPNGLTRGPDGTLYAVNFRDGGLLAIDQDGEVTELHRFPSANAHVAYLDGGLFVTSRASFVVYRYDLETGQVEIIAGNAEPDDVDGIGSEASFGRPNAITVGSDGALYINHADGSGSQPAHIKRIARR